MRERILEILSKALPQIDFEGSNELVDDGVLDSLSIVTLVAEISIEYGIVFELDELTPENLNSIDAIVDTVNRIVNQD